MKIQTVRDITLILIDEERYIAVSCDSCGGIGEKEKDVVKVSAQIAGEQTAKTVLSEIISIGAEPLMLSDGLAVEMEDTGRKIIEGIKNTINMLSKSSIHLTGSTEDNMKTVQTGMGITAIGMVEKANLKYNITNSSDLAVIIGEPLVGYDVVNNPDKVLDISDYEKIRGYSYIKEMIPIGSKGIGHEVNELCKYNNLSFNYKEKLDTNINKSAGPACCCVVTIEEKNYNKLKEEVKKPVEILGSFVNLEIRNLPKIKV